MNTAHQHKMKQKEIEKLNINLFPDTLQNQYEKEKSEFDIEKNKQLKAWKERRENTIKKNRPDVGLIEADKIWGKTFEEQHPRFGKEFKSFSVWSSTVYSLNAKGEQEVIDKINELTAQLNFLMGKKL